jgi:hypothetical protein
MEEMLEITGRNICQGRMMWEILGTVLINERVAKGSSLLLAQLR